MHFIQLVCCVVLAGGCDVSHMGTEFVFMMMEHSEDIFFELQVST